MCLAALSSNERPSQLLGVAGKKEPALTTLRQALAGLGTTRFARSSCPTHPKPSSLHPTTLPAPHCADALSALQRSRSCYGDPTAAVHSAPNLPLILSVLVDVASAMVYLQRNGFIHLDLKPENILLKVRRRARGAAKP